MATVNREVTITIDELRDAALVINEALRLTELAKLPSDQVPLVHAYQLGVLMRAAGVAPKSVGAVMQFVELGYHDYDAIKAAHEGERHE